MTHKPVGKPVIVFDFDGTLVASLEPLVKKVNTIVTRFGQKPLDEKGFRKWLPQGRDTFVSSWAPIQKLTSFFMDQVQSLQAKHIHEINAVPQMLPTLKLLHKHHFQLGLVSSNDKRFVHEFLTEREWSYLFSFVYAGDELFNKDNLLHKMLSEQHLDPEDVVYVGDELRDIEAAHAVRLPVIAVSWGFEGRDVFQNSNPDWLIDQPRQLLPIFHIPWWKQWF